MTLLLQGFVHPLVVVDFAHRGGGGGWGGLGCTASWTPRTLEVDSDMHN